jgi:cytosine/creatinine deaminase
MEPVPDARFLELAIEEALKGKAEGGIPIGAVLVIEARVIGRGRNRRVQDGDPIMHAEIACLQNAGRVGSFRQATLYSTLMPCYLCAGAIVQFGIPRVVIGESTTFAGAGTFLESQGVEICNLHSPRCFKLIHEFVCAHYGLWKEDIGEI